MSVKIRVYSDYVCPYCFLAKFTLDEVAKNTDIDVEWMPYELRPYPQPTLKPEGDYLLKTWKHHVYPLAEQMGVAIKLPSISPQPYSHLAFEGYQYAKVEGKEKAYNSRILKAFFQEDQDIGNIDVLTRLAKEVGLKEKDFRQALEERTYKETHRKALKHAYEEVGVTSVPTFVIGKQVLPGVLNEENLLRAITAAKEDE